MTAQQALTLKIGDRVGWTDPGADASPDGTIVEIGYLGVKVRWDDNIHSLLHYTGEGTGGVAFLVKRCPDCGPTTVCPHGYSDLA